MDSQISSIRFNHDTEFENAIFFKYYVSYDIDNNFSSLRIAKKNGIIERKNRTLEVMARTILIASDLPKTFWNEVVNIACYIINKFIIRFVNLI